MSDLKSRLEKAGKARAEKHRHTNVPFAGYSYEKGHSDLAPLVVELAEALKNIGECDSLYEEDEMKQKALASLEAYLEGGTK